MCLGQSAYDITLPMDHYPVENKKVRVEGKVECGGGSASNCAYLLAKWGLDTYFAGIIGKDHYGSEIKKEYERVGVNTKYLEINDKFNTTSSYIIANTDIAKAIVITFVFISFPPFKMFVGMTFSKTIPFYKIQNLRKFTIFLRQHE